jgi:hypothetical protein
MHVTPITPHLSNHQRLGLECLRDIYEVSAALATHTYIWGGLVVDILHGEFLRDHHDVDGFVLNLLDVKDEMAVHFAERDYAVSYLDEIDMLRIDRGDLHAAFNQLEIEGDLAMWRHVGDRGTVFFPAGWLDPTPRRFYGIPVHISGVRFEYAIKTNVQLLNPEWRLRDKDRAAIAILRAVLHRRGVDGRGVLAQIWSHTPYWVEKGYPDYADPVRAAPGVEGDGPCKKSSASGCTP